MKDAEEKAREYLAGSLPHRWQHTYAVAEKAAGFADQAGLSASDTLLLVSAAWLHNIGYAPQTPKTFEFAPLDGAELIASWGEPEIAALVAWHGLAAEESILIGLDGAMTRFPCPHGLVPDLLGYADLTTAATGQETSPSSRLTEITERYPAGHSTRQALSLGWPRIEALAQRAQAALNRT